MSCDGDLERLQYGTYFFVWTVTIWVKLELIHVPFEAGWDSRNKTDLSDFIKLQSPETNLMHSSTKKKIPLGFSYLTPTWELTLYRSL